MNDRHEGHERWADDLAAYMLGALEENEVAEFERHVESCERCRSELHWLQPAVTALPEGIERLEPPPALRQSLMSEVREDARRAAPAEPGSFRWLRRLGSGSFGWKPAVAMVTVVLAVVAFAGYQIGSDGGGVTHTDEKTYPISGLTAKVVTDDGHGTLEMENVEAVREGKVLEAWVSRDGAVEPVPELFAPDRAGNAATTIGDMRGVDAVLVTEEPAGGSQTPTMEPIVEIPIGT